MVSVADKIWKNKRIPDLEDLPVVRLARASGREGWQELADLDTLLEAIGSHWAGRQGCGRRRPAGAWLCHADLDANKLT